MITRNVFELANAVSTFEAPAVVVELTKRIQELSERWLYTVPGVCWQKHFPSGPAVRHLAGRPLDYSRAKQRGEGSCVQGAPEQHKGAWPDVNVIVRQSAMGHEIVLGLPGAIFLVELLSEGGVIEERVYGVGHRCRILER